MFLIQHKKNSTFLKNGQTVPIWVERENATTYYTRLYARNDILKFKLGNNAEIINK